MAKKLLRNFSLEFKKHPNLYETFEPKTIKSVSYCMRQTMVTLSGAPDGVVSWSDFSLLHKVVRKLNRICRTIFSLSYSSLWHILACVTCFGVMLSIGSSFYSIPS